MKKRNISLIIMSAAMILMMSAPVLAAGTEQKTAEGKTEITTAKETDTLDATAKESDSSDAAVKEDENEPEITLPIESDDVALQIALKHCGYTKEEAEEVIIEKDLDDGKEIYEVEFYVGVSKFDYDIDVATGTIIEYEVDD
ncbi:PepSY domain-containing protein [Butyrivibrio sp. LC3010]|uniref:PepSY domain-containing protein n=1 Tax=Butyrivibrio sp. LC3010 TaxID=1280680 RepID=UPI00041502D0|nr:PepSY domain-containing protein [Butyrivibrio sp. LC3010]